MDVHTRQMPIADDFDIAWVLDNTYGFVGADLAALVREAAIGHPTLPSKLTPRRKRFRGS